jgi:truncated hemoglobin YjbI
MVESTDRNMLDLLGGEAGCKRLAKDFYARVAKSAELRPLFPGKSVRCATEEFAAFLIQFLDGDPGHTQYRWWISLRESHARFKISENQRSTWLALMRETIDSWTKDSETRAALKQFFDVASAEIVGNGESAIEHRELCQRWDHQRSLDQLVDDIVHGRDEEAIHLSRQFASRPSVFVGILARLMEVGREPLITFVLESIQVDNQLMHSQFNGRSLLHHAAGSSCLLVVQQLLVGGTYPNVLDGGGHAPLYRAAGPRNAEQGAAIVRELVKAGATVDHAGGVNKSTALHQAARFGNLPVAEALLSAGAHPGLKDKKGLTPLDRARNCRRQDVAALLTSLNENRPKL